MFGPGARIEVPDSESLDISASLAFEAWIRVEDLPEAGRMGIIDNDGQYSLFIYDFDQYRCAAGGANLLVGPVIRGEWSHVACVHDAAANRLHLYVNGVERDSAGTLGELTTDSTNPIAIGDDSPSFVETFIGAIGGVRVWSTVRSAEQLCEAAGDLCDR